jgi:hypothetical protein
MGKPSLADPKLTISGSVIASCPLLVLVGQMLVWVVSVHSITSAVEVIFTPCRRTQVVFVETLVLHDSSKIAVAVPRRWVIALTGTR